MLPRERRAVGVIALIAICRMFGLFALLPVLAIFAADLDNATPMLIGIAVGGYGLTQAVLQIPFGALSDRIGRIPVIVFGLLLFAAGSIYAGQSDSRLQQRSQRRRRNLQRGHAGFDQQYGFDQCGAARKRRRNLQCGRR